MISILLVQYRTLYAFLSIFTFTTSYHPTDYNFDIDDNSKSTPSNKTSANDSRVKPPVSSKKNSVSSDDVFALFKGEQKVTIVSKKEERVQDAPATIYVITDKEIQERGYLFLHDALRDVP
ncbi:MAG TPA: hypothetical protein PLY93_06575, partial [Turneriella sp.]|nr:hypothetical protein [Turneriella sp.]